ncbi:MAG TPA: CdaR family protein [Chloroflexota bacterium]|nr:CdaR family protein [Chloroflexota bacterium]
MSERGHHRPLALLPRSRTFGTAAAGTQLSWLWSRESILRLLLSLVLALALWLYITNKQDPNVVQDYGQPLPVTVANVPDGMTVSNVNPGFVYVRIRRQDPAAPISQANFHAFVDLIGLKPGLHHAHVQVIADPGIQVVSWQPQTVPILLERTQTRTVPVQPTIYSQPPTGFGTTIITTPKQVEVSGPNPLVSEVARATFDVDLSGLASTVSGTYRLTPENAGGGVVTGHLNLTPSSVHVTIQVNPESSYKTVPILPDIAGNPATGNGVVSVTVNPPDLTASGAPKALAGLSAVHTKPISVSNHRAGTFTRHVPVILPRSIHSRTRTVTVTTTLAPVEASSSVQIAVTPINVAQGLIVHMRPARVLVTIAGPANKLRRAAAGMRATINLAGYGSGTFTLTPIISTPPGISLEGTAYPSFVVVTLTTL